MTEQLTVHRHNNLVALGSLLDIHADLLAHGGQDGDVWKGISSVIMPTATYPT